jgi:hypothetical protein
MAAAPGLIPHFHEVERLARSPDLWTDCAFAGSGTTPCRGKKQAYGRHELAAHGQCCPVSKVELERDAGSINSISA